MCLLCINFPRTRSGNSEGCCHISWYIEVTSVQDLLDQSSVQDTPRAQTENIKALLQSIFSPTGPKDRANVVPYLCVLHPLQAHYWLLSPPTWPSSPWLCPDTDGPWTEILKPWSPAREELDVHLPSSVNFQIILVYIEQHHYAHFKEVTLMWFWFLESQT